MSSPTRDSVAFVLAQDIADGRTLRAGSFDNVSFVTTGSAYSDLDGAFFYVSFSGHGPDQRMFKVRVTEG